MCCSSIFQVYDVRHTVKKGGDSRERYHAPVNLIGLLEIASLPRMKCITSEKMVKNTRTRTSARLVHTRRENTFSNLQLIQTGHINCWFSYLPAHFDHGWKSYTRTSSSNRVIRTSGSTLTSFCRKHLSIDSQLCDSI